MKNLHEFRSHVVALLNRKPVTILLSVFFAVIIWFAIVVNVYPSTPVSFYQVPLEIDLTGTAAEQNGLSLVSCDVEAVNVELTGNRSQIGILTAEDLTATADLGTINAAGEYPVSLTVKASNGISFQVDSITPATATVQLDKIETRSYPVEPSFPGVVVTAGHALNKDEVLCDPSEIEITGPAAQLDEISKVEVYSDKKLEIDSAYLLYTSDVRLYSQSGAQIDDAALEIPKVDFQIDLPVLTQRELQLTYRVTGAPQDFDLPWLQERLKLSEDTITMASQNSSAFTGVDTWDAGFVRLSDIDLDYTGTLKIAEEEGCINESGIQEVTLSLDNEGLDKRTFRVTSDNISIINAPTTYDFRIVTKQLEVTVVGEASQLEELQAEDIFITVNLMNYANAEQSASFPWSPSISFHQKDHLWAIGSYNISLERSEPETSTTDTSLEE